MRDLAVRFEHWLGHFQKTQGGASARLARRVRLCGSESYDFASHLAPDDRLEDALVVDLWTLRRAPTSKRAFGEACARLELANCLYDQVREGFLRRRRDPKPVLVLRGNLVSPSVAPDPELAMVAESGHRVRLWTYSFVGGTFEVLPYCATSAARLPAKAGTLSRFLSRLSYSGRSPKTGPSNQRRRFERQSVSIRARVMLYDAAGRWAGEGEATISDLSSAGARLTSISAPADMETLSAGSVILFPREGRVALPADVVRFQARTSPGMGVRFRELSRLTRIGLKRILLASGQVPRKSLPAGE